MNLLIVEDDDSVSSFLKQATAEAGYNVEVVGDGVNALRMARAAEFDLILLDVMLPRMSGFDVCRELRKSGTETPVLMITARDSLEDKVEGLDSGADDYIVKPFQVAELLARARALLRRGKSSPVELTVADLKLSPATRRATRSGKPIHLSATEFSLLEYLMRNAGQVLTRSMILQHVWEYDFQGNDNVLEVYICYLRGKVDKGHPVQLIHTLRGVGYRMDADEF